MTPALPEAETPTPDEEMEELAPQGDDFGPNFRNLPDQLKNAITDVCKEAQEQEKYMRRMEILQDSMHRFYDMGNQHIYLNSQYSFNQATPGGVFTGPNGQEAFG